MRILITGGFGFVGGRLARHLQYADHEIVLGARKENSPPEWLPHAAVLQTDWVDEIALARICAGVDVVIHAAGMNAQDCAANPLAALEFNGLATARLLGAAIRAGVKRFIYLSTAHVYASPLSGIITESTCPQNMHTYATSHLAGENAVLGAAQRRQIEGVVLRLSNAFGVPAHKDVNCWMLLVNDLCRQSVTGHSLVLRSAGLQRRDFVSLENVARAVAHLIGLCNEEIGDGVFNIGGMWSPRVIDVVGFIKERCSEVLRFTPEIVCATPKDGEETLDLDFRINKLRSTGFSLSAEVSSEIDATLLFCRKFFSN